MRYVNDINVAADEVPQGTSYKNGHLVVKEKAVESDSLIPIDKKTIEVIREIGHSIHQLIQLEVDHLSNHGDGKMLILDLNLGSRKLMIYMEMYTNSMLLMFYLMLLCLPSQHFLENKNGQF